MPDPFDPLDRVGSLRERTASLETSVEGLRRDLHRAHVENVDRFEAVDRKLDARAVAVDERFDEIKAQLAPIVKALNMAEGGWGVLVRAYALIAGTLTLVAAAIAWLFGILKIKVGG